MRLGSAVAINPESVTRHYPYAEIEYIDISSVGTGTLNATRRLGLGAAPSRARRIVRRGDTLLATVRPNLRAFWFAREPAENTVASTGFAVLRGGRAIDDRYLYYVVSDQAFTDYLTANVKGAAYPAVDAETIRRAEVPVGPLETQRKIAGILSAYDDLIENNLRRIEILEEMARNLYREWFGEFRFPGHERARFVDSAVGRIPDGWRVERLSDLVDTQYGYTASARSEPVGPKFLRGMDINKTTFVDWSRVPQCEIDDDGLRRFRLSKGDILLIRMADPGKPGMVEAPVEAVFASYLVRLRFRDLSACGTYYLFYFLLGDAYQEYISGASTGTTRKSASAGTLTGVALAIPPEDLLGRFEDAVAALRGLLGALVERNAILRQARDLLLPKLISGDIDVSTLPVRRAASAGNGAGKGDDITRYEFFRAIADLPFVDKIVLFGSRARGDHEDRSDIDLAVFCDDASDEDWAEVLACLQEDRIDTLRKVDCVRFDECDAVLRENVLSEGVVLYEKGTGA